MNKENNVRPLKPLAEIFAQQNPCHAGDKIRMIQLSSILDFPNHTFEIHSEDEDFKRLYKSIETNGIESPLILQVTERNDQYFCISGHRRKAVAHLLNMNVVPAIIKNYDSETALDLMIGSNLTQRSRIRPSEWLACILSKLGLAKNHSEQHGGKASSYVAVSLNISSRQVENYLTLQSLFSDWMNLLNEEQLSLSAAEKIAHLTLDSQTTLYTLCSKKSYIPSAKNCSNLLAYEKTNVLTEDSMIEILWDPSKVKLSTKKLTLHLDRFYEYLPPHIKEEEIENCLLELLKTEKERNI